LATAPPLTRAHRRDLSALTGLAQEDLALIWRRLDTADTARDALLEVLPQLVAVYGSAAATLGADWYDETREAAAVAGRFRAVPAELPDQGRTDALARWAVSPLYTEHPDFPTALVKATGGLQRIIADADRQTVAESAVADPAASGWQRVGSGECAFCAMLIGRGGVYTEAGSDFASHDHCQCTAVAAFDGQERPVKPFTPSTKTSSDADRARVRAYLKANPANP
jgi:hypothetical protein